MGMIIERRGSRAYEIKGKVRGKKRGKGGKRKREI